MSIWATPARYLRAGLVGTSSALFVATAHIAGGGGTPTVRGVLALTAVCATAGVGVGTVRVSGRRARVGLVTLGLLSSQASGHLALASAGEHHHHMDCGQQAGWQMTVPMLGLHLGAAVLLGLLIGLSEHLLAMGSSVLHWLRLFGTVAVVPYSPPVPRLFNLVVRQAVLLLTGLGMRAPPHLAPVGA